MRARVFWVTASLAFALGQVWVAIEYGAEVVQTYIASLTLVTAVIFSALFARDPWWKTWFGRSLMLIAFALFLDSLATVLFRRFGEYPGRPFMLIISANVALAAMVMRTLVLRAAQKRDRARLYSDSIRH